MKRTLLSLLLALLAIPLFSQNIAPVAMDDSATTLRGALVIDVLNNDQDPDSDYFKILTIFPQPKHGYANIYHDSLIRYRSFPDYPGGMDTLIYVVRDYGVPPATDTAMLVLTVDNSLYLDSISANNIKTGVSSDGYLFCKRKLRYDGTCQEYLPFFEAPAGDGVHSLFSGGLWIGGFDVMSTLHLAGRRYGSNGEDFWAGPVSSVYDSAYDARYNRVWKITRDDIDDHLAHCWQPGYVPSARIAEWPGNGDVSQGQSRMLAPFYDWNGDSIYNPWAGDFPLFSGDEALLFIVNDARNLHTESGGLPLNVEFVGLLYAFDCPADEALWNTVFLKLRMTNRSTYNYHNVYFGSFVDLDLGSAFDDFLGCDVQRGSYYAYNGSSIDGSGGTGTYGDHPAMQAVTYLAGPYMSPDGMDNPRFDSFGNVICDEGINGAHFGDYIVDNERFGLNHFVAFSNAGGFFPALDPETAADMYQIMTGVWSDGEPLRYWGNGHPNSGGTGPVCRFMFPESSDTCNWGTAGIDPGGTEPWTEIQAGNTPYDRRGIGSSGPTELPAGCYWQEVDMAFVFARNMNDTGAMAALPIMQQYIDSVRSYFVKDSTPCGGGFSGINHQKPVERSIRLWPNPATNQIEITFPEEVGLWLEIYNASGIQQVRTALDPSGQDRIPVSSLAPGLYFIRICGPGVSQTARFIKI